MRDKRVIAERISAREEKGLRRLLEEGVERGLLERETRNIPYVLWRFNGAGIPVIVICYEKKRKRRDHGLVVEHGDDIGPLVLGGEWDELEDYRAERMGGRDGEDGIRGPMSRLHLVEPESDRDTGPGNARVLRRGDLSPHQEAVFEAVLDWVREPGEQVLTLGGYAGTGKTTVIAALGHELRGIDVAYCAPTGKAALVMRKKLGAASVDLGARGCGTIHRLIYRPRIDRRTGRIVGMERAETLDADLVVVDEASMVDERVYQDLTSFEVPILAVGDHGQLPPVRGGLNLMRSPDLTLTEIHRQAEGHPIVRLSASVRRGEPFDSAIGDDPRVRRIESGHEADLADLLSGFVKRPEDSADTAVLCYTNRTRARINRLLRDGFGFEAPLVPGDVVVCLRDTYFDALLLANGLRGRVESVEGELEHHVRARVLHPEDGYLVDGWVLTEQLGRAATLDSYDDLAFEPAGWHEVGLLYDYGYALTVHKAQGSQYRRVVVCLERPAPVSDDDWRRWLYTAVTRATDELVLIG